MADTKTYTVLRAMHGDGRDYARGDTREMTPLDAEPLVKLGALALEGEEARVRKPGVQHTFGTRPSEINERGYTSATGEGIITPDAPAKAATRRQPART